MSTEVTITFYKIQAAGYYSTKKNNGPAFGAVESILHDLKTWSKDKLLQDTRTTSADAETELFPTYLAAINKKHSKWLLSMWNQVPDADGKILSLPGHARVGSATTTENDIEPGTIPGFATYFWFIPEKSVFASIRIDQPQTCQLAMQLHIKSFMTLHSGHVVKTEPDSEGKIKIVGYKENDDADVLRAIPKFWAQIYTMNGDKEYILSNAERVRKFTRKEEFSLLETENTAAWQKRIRSVLPGYKKPVFLQDSIAEQSFNTSLKQTEIKKLIKEWEQNSNSSVAIDYCFEFRNDSKKYWLSHAYARDKYELDLTRNSNNGIIEPNSLLDELEKHRSQIMSLLGDV